MCSFVEPKKVVILGAGIGGLRVALNLESKTTSNLCRIILLDENSYHQYLYRIHEICGLDYNEKDIIVPIRKLIYGKNIKFQMSKVKDIDPKQHVVETSRGELKFDILVIALGSHAEFYGIEGVKEHSLVLDSFESAKRMRCDVEKLFMASKGEGRAPKIVICGGGFTGTELAGELTDWLPVLFERYGFESSEKLATLVEAMSSILPGWDPDLVKRAQDVLTSRGIELMLGDPVSRVSKDGVEVKSGLKLESDLTIWTGGVTCDPACGNVFDIRSRRICIDDYCRAIGFEDIYVVGDSSCAVDAETGEPLPPSAHIAMAQADVVSHNIHASLIGGEMKRYAGKRIGEIVTLGEIDAVGNLWGKKVTGSPAKFIKRLIHWWYLFSIGG